MYLCVRAHVCVCVCACVCVCGVVLLHSQNLNLRNKYITSTLLSPSHPGLCFVFPIATTICLWAREKRCASEWNVCLIAKQKTSEKHLHSLSDFMYSKLFRYLKTVLLPKWQGRYTKLSSAKSTVLPSAAKKRDSVDGRAGAHFGVGHRSPDR